MQNEGRLNDGLLPYDYASLVPDWDKIESGQWQGTNWFKEIMNEDALVQNYSLNMNGGSDRSVYSFGAAYLDDQGVLGKQAKSRYKRLNLRLNSEHIVWQKGQMDSLRNPGCVPLALHQKHQLAAMDGAALFPWPDVRRPHG